MDKDKEVKKKAGQGQDIVVSAYSKKSVIFTFIFTETVAPVLATAWREVLLAAKILK